MQLTKDMDKSMLTLVLTSFGIIVILNFIPILNVVLFPFKLFSTFVHETFHGVAAIVTGGSWVKFAVNFNTSGVAYTRPGLMMVIAPAGYLGTSLMGGILLLLSARMANAAKKVLVTIGLVMMTITFIFAESWFSTTGLVGIIFGAFILLMGLFVNKPIAAFLLNFLAVTLCMNAIIDVKNLFSHTSAGAGFNDAVAMNRMIPIGAMTWSIIYIALSLLITYIFVKKALRGPTDHTKTDVRGIL